jgi:hypothetical protein
MNDYTVLLLRPDTNWNGPAADWVLREFVNAFDVKGAVKVACGVAVETYYNDAPDVNADSFAPIAVYPGHVTDLYDPHQ